MARRPLKPCAAPACSVLLRGDTYCPAHQAQHEVRKAERIKQANKSYNERRDMSDGFYGQGKWRGLSIRFRKLNPLCVECKSNGVIKASQLVDHIMPRKTHPELSYEWRNLRALCWACHNRVGARVGLTGSVSH